MYIASSHVAVLRAESKRIVLAKLCSCMSNYMQPHRCRATSAKPLTDALVAQLDEFIDRKLSETFVLLRKDSGLCMHVPCENEHARRDHGKLLCLSV